MGLCPPMDAKEPNQEKAVFAAGQETRRAGKMVLGQGAAGGAALLDHAKQKELAGLCLVLAEAGQTVITEDHQGFRLAPAAQVLGPRAAAKQICMTLSSFKNGCGQTIAGRGAQELRGPWLERTLRIARQMHAQWPGAGTMSEGGGPRKQVGRNDGNERREP